MREGLTRENDVKIRWREYFGQLLNGDPISEGGGNDNVGEESVGGNERVIIRVLKEEIISALKKMNGSKPAGRLDGIVVEMLKQKTLA